MATNTGGQRQTTKRADETEQAEPASTEEVRERHEKLSDDVDAILDEIDEVPGGERGGVRPVVRAEGRPVTGPAVRRRRTGRRVRRVVPLWHGSRVC